MAVWRQHLHLAIGLIVALGLHLLVGFGLNVYGVGTAPRKISARIDVRLARAPVPPRAAGAAPSSIAPSVTAQRRVPQAVARSPLQLSYSAAAAPLVPPPAQQEVPPPEPPVNLPEPPLPDTPTLGLIEMPDLEFYPASELDQVAEPLAPPAVNFPLSLGHNPKPGMVIMLLKIDENGVVLDADIEYSDPPGLYDKAALGPFIYARYTPAQKGGKPVRSQKRIEVIFGDYRRPQLPGPFPPPAR